MGNVLNQSIKVNKVNIKNRILMPPLVCFNWADNDGFETYDRAVHYGKRAAGGTGLVVIEATAISKEGRLCDTELGLWKDEHIPQFSKIAEACRKENSVALVQIVHAGMKSVEENVLSASSHQLDNKKCFEMTLEQIEIVKRDFVDTSIRAQKAGLDGVEIHGAHGYLLNQFTSKETNKRSDIYGGSLENRFRLSLEVTKAIREATGDDFIIGYRFGVNDPTFEEDIILARELEKAGVNLLNVSAGIGFDHMKAPSDYPFSLITYMGTEIYKHVDIPVVCVGNIRDPKDAEHLISNNMIDIVAVGRGILADPNWGNKAIAGQKVNRCYHCKPRCKYGQEGTKCPWFKK